MNNQKTNFLNLFLIIFTFILFISGAYYLGKQSTVIPVSNPVGVLPKTTVTPTVTTDPTANWKTYKNNQYGFEVKYPSIYIIDSEKDEYDTSFITSIRSNDLRYETEGIARAYVTFIAGISINNKKCQNLILEDTSVQWHKTNIIESNSSMVVIETEDPMGSPYKTQTAYFTKGEECFTVWCFSSEADCGNNNLGKQFTQILSTFKFTE